MLKRKLVHGIVIPNICVKLYQNWIITEGTREMTMFSKNSLCELDLNPRTLKLELVHDIVILNICVIKN